MFLRNIEKAELLSKAIESTETAMRIMGFWVRCSTTIYAVLLMGYWVALDMSTNYIYYLRVAPEIIITNFFVPPVNEAILIGAVVTVVCAVGSRAWKIQSGGKADGIVAKS